MPGGWTAASPTFKNVRLMIGDGIRSTNQAPHDYVAQGRTVGFLTDPTLCIGCKACEVACKEWNRVPDDGYTFTATSYDNTGALGASTWRHVKFVELDAPLVARAVADEVGRAARAAGVEAFVAPAGEAQSGGGVPSRAGADTVGWVFLSDVCKHCEVAGCLEACPTGAIVRTEVGSVYLQDDVCNGCGYCVVTCPFGVVDRRPAEVWAADYDALAARDFRPHRPVGGGGAHKCTFCYDRQIDGMVPACAKACPTESIAFGPLDELRARADARVSVLRARGLDDVSVYDPRDTSVRGVHALFVVPGDPARFGLPEAPEAPVVYLAGAWISAAATAVAMIVAVVSAFAVLGTAGG